MELIERLYGFDSWGEALRHQMATVPRKKLPDSARGAAGNVFLHPGAGVVEKVEGWEEVLRLPGVVEARLRLKPGDRISPRLGTGQTRGWVTVEGDDAEIVAATLAEVESRLRVTLR